MPFGLTEHMGASAAWWDVSRRCDKEGPYAGIPYDGGDPQYKDLYLADYDTGSINKESKELLGGSEWYTKNPSYHEYWLKVMKELIDLYTPDLLYSDGALPFEEFGVEEPGGAAFRAGLEAVSYLYNSSINRFGRNNAVYLQKDKRPEICGVGIWILKEADCRESVPSRGIRIPV